MEQMLATRNVTTRSLPRFLPCSINNSKRGCGLNTRGSNCEPQGADTPYEFLNRIPTLMLEALKVQLNPLN